MRIVRNERLIRRNGKVGQWTSIAGLITLAGGMYISIRQPERYGLTVAALLVGFSLTQISMYFGNRFGRSPRPDERLDAGLKGLPGDFQLFHYSTPVPHLMIGPAGVWVLLPYHQRGKITYQNNRWRLAGGGLLQSYLRIFGQEGLGNPTATAAQQLAEAEKFVAAKLNGSSAVRPGALVVFTDDNADLSAVDAPIPALKLRHLKDFMRQRAKERPVSPADLGRLTVSITNS